ncbi:MAG: hypothetical protein GC145_15930 [Caulobacter sp.]|nr:hypothetical protein [Caulobacter sp.]
MERRALTIVERVRLGLRWYGLVVCVLLIVVAVAAWAANLRATWSDGDLTGKLWLSLVTLGVIAAFVWFFRVIEASRRQLLARTVIREDGDADPAER